MNQFGESIATICQDIMLYCWWVYKSCNHNIGDQLYDVTHWIKSPRSYPAILILYHKGTTEKVLKFMMPL